MSCFTKKKKVQFLDGGQFIFRTVFDWKNPGWETPRKETFYVKSDTKD